MTFSVRFSQLRTPSNSTIEDVFFSEQDVKDRLKKLKQDSAAGPDGITPRILKGHIDILSKPLSIFFSKSMSTWLAPEDWKAANVPPMFKKGSKSFLTSVPCKLMEAIIREKFVNHLLTNQLINASQHGFMNKKSCTTNLLDFLEKVTSIV